MPLIFFSIPTCHFRDDPLQYDRMTNATEQGSHHELTDDQKHAVGALIIVGVVYVIGKEE